MPRLAGMAAVPGVGVADAEIVERLQAAEEADAGRLAHGVEVAGEDGVAWAAAMSFSTSRAAATVCSSRSRSSCRFHDGRWLINRRGRWARERRSRQSALSPGSRPFAASAADRANAGGRP